MAKNECKIQISWKHPDGRIELIRGDDKKELIAAHKDLLDFYTEQVLADVVEQQDKEYSQDPNDYDESICPIHKVEMELRPGVEGRYKAFYSHKTTDEAYNNDPQYDSWFCNGRPPKRRIK